MNFVATKIWLLALLALGLVCGSDARALTILDFTATWCGPCQTMVPIVEQAIREGADIRTVDVDAEPATAARYAVGPIPCFVAIDAQGNAVGRIDGTTSIDKLRTLAGGREFPANGARSGGNERREGDRRSARAQITAAGVGGKEYLTRVATAAEASRKQVGLDWFDDPDIYPDQGIQITVRQIDASHGGGATTFAFDGGRCCGPHTSTVQGTAEGILVDILPHEVHHMVFAQHYGRQIPRWLDEGSAGQEETKTEQHYQHSLLADCLRQGRGMPFGQLAGAKDYPDDVMTFYAESYSAVDFLVQHGGRRHFAAWLGDVMQSGYFPATEKYYGYQSFPQMQDAWLSWVMAGIPRAPEQVTVFRVGPNGNCRCRNSWYPGKAIWRIFNAEKLAANDFRNQNGRPPGRPLAPSGPQNPPQAVPPSSSPPIVTAPPNTAPLVAVPPDIATPNIPPVATQPANPVTRAPAGTNGVDGATVEPGAAGAIGATGPTGGIGPAGARGPVGATGAPGATGATGAPGTSPDPNAIATTVLNQLSQQPVTLQIVAPDGTPLQQTQAYLGGQPLKLRLRFVAATQ